MTVPGDAGIIGARSATQGLDLNTLDGCPASLFGVSFRVTETVHVFVR